MYRILDSLVHVMDSYWNEYWKVDQRVDGVFTQRGKCCTHSKYELKIYQCIDFDLNSLVKTTRMHYVNRCNKEFFTCDRDFNV